ncbi:hypothetical protein [Streptomyces sp. NPDC059970]|uniref:HNH endonuclease n=2 Tax=Streptomyces TaxID=1883 RepID=UPI0036AA8DA8
MSPLPSNVALSVLDEHIAQGPGGPASSQVERAKRRRHGQPNHQLVRFADDWCLMVSGTRADAEALREEIAEVLSTRMGLRLSQEKTLVTHINDGLDFLGWHIQRHRKRGTDRCYVYTYPSRKALKAVMAKGIPLRRRKHTRLIDGAWPTRRGRQLIARLTAGTCELCDSPDGITVHHVKRLADLNRYSTTAAPDWVNAMRTSRRKTLIVCTRCHGTIHQRPDTQ